MADVRDAPEAGDRTGSPPVRSGPDGSAALRAGQDREAGGSPPDRAALLSEARRVLEVESRAVAALAALNGKQAIDLIKATSDVAQLTRLEKAELAGQARKGVLITIANRLQELG